MDSRKCQTVTVSPAKPGDFPFFVKETDAIFENVHVAKDEMKKYSEKIYKSTTIPRWRLAILGGTV